MTDPVPSKEVFNVGHGHVYPRTDGVKAKCGGPGLCKECSSDLAHQQRQESPSKDQFPDVKITPDQPHRILDAYEALFRGGLEEMRRAARLLVQREDEIAKLESDLAWIRRRTGFWGEVPAEPLTWEAFWKFVRESNWNPTADEMRKILNAKVIEGCTDASIPPCVTPPPTELRGDELYEHLQTRCQAMWRTNITLVCSRPKGHEGDHRADCGYTFNGEVDVRAAQPPRDGQ